MAQLCRDCGSKAVEWRDTPDGRRLFDAFRMPKYSEDPASIRQRAEHWLTCPSDFAKRLRIRRGLEPGIFPISVSRILAYRRCPRWYKLIYQDGFADSTPPATLIGRDVHAYAAAKLLGIEPLPGPTQTPPEFRSEWPELTRLVDWRLTRIKTENIIGVEERIPVTWQDGALTVALEVAIDLMEAQDDLLVIHDHKAGWHVPNEEEMRSDLQTWTYAWAARTRYPSKRRYRVSQTHYRFQAREVWVQFRAEELDAFGDGLKDEVRRIARDIDFKPNPSCDYCPPAAHAMQIQPYRSVTLTTANGLTRVDMPPIQTDEDYRVMAGRLRVAEQIVYAVKGRMKEYAKEHGPAILPDGGGYGFWYQGKREWNGNLLKILQSLEAAGVPVGTVASLDLDALKTYMTGRKKIPGLAEAVEQAYLETPDAAYGWRKDAAGAATTSLERAAKAQAKIEAAGDAIVANMAPLRVLEGGGNA